MFIQEYHPLKHLHTFRLPAVARVLVTVETHQDLLDLHKQGFFRDRFLVLGEGSNTLFTGDMEDPVLLMRIKGMEVLLSDPEGSVVVRVGAGEHWDDLVEWTVRQGWGGIEHLASIPGTCGAAPVQNIGAYGRELSQVVERVDVFDCTTGAVHALSPEECGFSYRESVFKREEGRRWIILGITLRLHSGPSYRPDTSYRALADELASQGDAHSAGHHPSDGDHHPSGAGHPSIVDVWNAVKRIRAAKLPDPAHTPNAGSFFKNPVIPEDQAASLSSLHPDMPSFPDRPGHRKIPAGWLIERAGWKGRMEGSVGTWPKQALVLIHDGKATGGDVVAVMNLILDDVETIFSIRLQTEVNLMPPIHG
jgi:UDP-N-acetylmuramate dehydrogenase